MINSRHAYVFTVFQRFLLIFLFSLQYWSITPIHPSTATLTGSQAIIETVNLEISRNITCESRLTTFTIQKTLYQLTSSNQGLFAGFRVCNKGQALKKVSITINLDDCEWDQTFYYVENLLDIYYDFSLESELIVPLNGLPALPEISSFQATFSLEYYPSVSNFAASFQLLNSEISQVLDVPSSEVIGIPSNFFVEVTTSDTLQHRNRFVLSTYYITKIPLNSKLYVTLHLDTTLQIESLDLLGATITSSSENIRSSQRVEMILDKNFTKVGLKLKIVEVLEVTIGEIIIHIEKTVLSTDTPNLGGGIFPEINLPPHPIPEEVMSIVLVLFLFGVPAYKVHKHQENEAKKRLSIMRE